MSIIAFILNYTSTATTNFQEIIGPVIGLHTNNCKFQSKGQGQFMKKLNMLVTLTRFCFVAVGGMSRPPKPVVQIKKVAPPAVPDTQGFRHSGSSFGSAGYSSAGEDHVFHDHSRGKSPSKLQD